MKHRSVLLLFLTALLAMCLMSCSKETEGTEPAPLQPMEHVPGRTGYREMICDITPEDMGKNDMVFIDSVMFDSKDYYAVIKTVDMTNGSVVSNKLYSISQEGKMLNSFDLGVQADFYVLAGENVACIANMKTDFLSLSDGSVVQTVESERNPIAASSYGDGYVVGYQGKVVQYDSSGKEIARIDNKEFMFSKYSDIVFERGDSVYLVTNPGFEYAYWEIDFSDGSAKRVNSSTDLGLMIQNCFGEYVADGSGLFKLDPVSGEMMTLAEWKNTNVRPGGNPMMGYRLYYVFDDDRFVEAFTMNGTACIQIYEYDSNIDYSDRKIITIGGFDISTDYPLNCAVYEFNSSQDEYRAVINEFKNDSVDTETEQERNLRMIAEFNNGNAPDIFYGNAFDYDYFGRNGLVLDLIPYLEGNGRFSTDDIEPSIWKTLCKDGHCYHLIVSFMFNGYWGKESVMSSYTNMSYEDMFDLDNPEGRVSAANYARETVAFIIGHPFANMIGSNGEFLLTQDQLEDIVSRSVEVGIPGSADFEMLGEEGFDHLRSDEYLMTWTIVTGLTWFDDCTKQAGDNLIYLGFPSVGGAAHMIQPLGNMAVSSGTMYPEGCVDLMTYMLGDTVQKQMIANGYSSVMRPVNELFFKYAMDPSSVPEEDPEFRMLLSMREPISEETIDSFRNAIDSIDYIQVYDWSVYQIITEEIETYYTQDKTAEQIADVLYSRLKVYVQENYS